MPTKKTPEFDVEPTEEDVPNEGEGPEQKRRDPDAVDPTFAAYRKPVATLEEAVYGTKEEQAAAAKAAEEEAAEEEPEEEAAT